MISSFPPTSPPFLYCLHLLRYCLLISFSLLLVSHFSSSFIPIKIPNTVLIASGACLIGNNAKKKKKPLAIKKRGNINEKGKKIVLEN